MSDTGLGFRDPSDPRRRRRPTRPPGPGRCRSTRRRRYVVPRHRARRQPVRAGRDRQHLHADHEPDAGGVRGAHRRLEGGATAVGIPARSPWRPARRPRRSPSSTWPRPATTSCRRPSLYGGTYNLFHYTLPKLGIEIIVRRRPRRPRRVARPRSGRTPRRSSARRIGNPKNDVLDIEGVAEVAHENGIPLIVDNTVPTPYLIRPFEWGADIVVHSATKFIGGHGTSIGGVIVDGGTFDFGASGRFPSFTEPDPSYHGLAVLAGARPGRLHHQGPRAAAARHRRGDLAVQRLPVPAGPRDAEPADGAPHRQRPGGGRVPRRPATRSSGSTTPACRRARGTSGPRSTAPARAAARCLAFIIKGGSEAGKRFVEALELHSHVANIGDVRSLVIHPASTTHSQLTERSSSTTGVRPGPRAAVGRPRVDRRHPRRPRRRLPRRQGLARPASHA